MIKKRAHAFFDIRVQKSDEQSDWRPWEGIQTTSAYALKVHACPTLKWCKDGDLYCAPRASSVCLMK